MRQRRPSRIGTALNAARKRSSRRPPSTATAQPEEGEVPPEVRAPNRIDSGDPLNEEELRALAAGWRFVE